MDPVSIFWSGFAGVVLLLIAISLKRQTGRLKRLGGVLEGGRFQRGLFSAAMEGRFQGRPARVSYSGRGKVPELHLALTCRAPFSFEVVYEQWGGRGARPPEGGGDLVLGDPEAGRRVVFSSDSPGRFLDWMGRPEVREHAAALALSEGVRYLDCHRGRLRIACRRDKPEVEAERARGMLARLAALARSLEGLP